MNETYKLVEKKFFYRNKNEKINLTAIRSIFGKSDIKKKRKFTKNNIRRIRPGFGLSPVYYEKILNKTT